MPKCFCKALVHVVPVKCGMLTERPPSHRHDLLVHRCCPSVLFMLEQPSGVHGETWALLLLSQPAEQRRSIRKYDGEGDQGQNQRSDDSVEIIKQNALSQEIFGRMREPACHAKGQPLGTLRTSKKFECAGRPSLAVSRLCGVAVSPHGGGMGPLPAHQAGSFPKLPERQLLVA